MNKEFTSKHTASVHAGAAGDLQYNGLITPVFPSSAYDYEGVPITLYPRYFNTPNQKIVAEKLAVLEKAADGIIFSSGMAAIVTTLMALLKKGDHVVFQRDLYGGTFYAITKEFPKYGLSFTFVEGDNPEDFLHALTPETKLIYVESPSNPLLKIIDLARVAEIARQRGILTMIDNTFASPINQNPITLGIDIVAHSGTKYIGGHSDICCGAVLSSKEIIARVLESAIHFGGTLDAHTCWLVERSIKTLALRVNQQNINAQKIAEALSETAEVDHVYYPGLPSHPSHAIAAAQMTGFGGMLSFEVSHMDTNKLMSRLQLIRRAVSLGGVESTITSPAKTSHAKLTKPERMASGVTDQLLRLSVGIEDGNDLIDDLLQAIKKN